MHDCVHGWWVWDIEVGCDFSLAARPGQWRGVPDSDYGYWDQQGLCGQDRQWKIPQVARSPRKYIFPYKDHVYRICFKILTNRQVGTLIIDYNAEVEYKYDISEIKVPDNLLKDEDTKNAYTIAEKMENDLTKYLEFKERRK